jgi:hypothetical protein
MLTHLHKKNIYSLIVITCLCLMFTGCFFKEDPAPAPVKSMEELCPLPTSKLIDQAMKEARNTLSNPDCIIRFNIIFDHLIRIAANDPKKNNSELFTNFLDWAVERSIISPRQSREIYTGYFSYKFVALPRDYQTCDYCKNISKIIREMKEELNLKESGMLKICKDQEGYRQAQSDYVNMKTILKATCKACQTGD